MRWSAIGLGIGAAVLLIPALVYVWSQPDVRSRRAVRVYLVPGLIVLLMAAMFAVVWLVRHAA
jgi:hypothetical protein